MQIAVKSLSVSLMRESLLILLLLQFTKSFHLPISSFRALTSSCLCEMVIRCSDSLSGFFS
ncbi:MAG TPA: hypothetical protein DCE14_09555 [Kosmotogaceae bacterium]|nr:hypothetical protein [Kosmotogaceae bacterium]